MRNCYYSQIINELIYCNINVINNMSNNIIIIIIMNIVRGYCAWMNGYKMYDTKILGWTQEIKMNYIIVYKLYFITYNSFQRLTRLPTAFV